MKKTFTFFWVLMMALLKRGKLTLLFSALFCTVASGQREMPQFRQVDREAFTNFLKTVSPGVVIEALSRERAKQVEELNDPNWGEVSEHTYESYYLKLLDYIMSDIQAGNPVDETVWKSYDRILQEGSYDQNLNEQDRGLLNEGEFISRLSGSLSFGY